MVIPRNADMAQLAGRSLVAGISALSTAGTYLSKAASSGVASLSSRRGGREAIRWVAFDTLRWTAPGDDSSAHSCPVLLLAYDTGFQIWSLEDPAEPRELSSRRDGPVR